MLYALHNAESLRHRLDCMAHSSGTPTRSQVSATAVGMEHLVQMNRISVHSFLCSYRQQRAPRATAKLAGRVILLAVPPCLAGLLCTSTYLHTWLFASVWVGRLNFSEFLELKQVRSLMHALLCNTFCVCCSPGLRRDRPV